MNKLIGATLLLLLGLTFVVTVNATSKCIPIYNGGQGACLNTSPTAKPAITKQATTQATPTPKTIAYAQPITTKGGFPVAQTQQTKTTPQTGASEDILAILVISGIVGVFLRKQTAFTAV